jgi:hypothetical protein
LSPAQFKNLNHAISIIQRKCTFKIIGDKEKKIYIYISYGNISKTKYSQVKCSFAGLEKTGKVVRV